MLAVPGGYVCLIEAVPETLWPELLTLYLDSPPQH